MKQLTYASRIKAEILCNGLKLSNKAFKFLKKNYSYVFDDEYMHGAFLLLENGYSINAAISEKYTRNANLVLQYEQGSLFVQLKNKKPFKVSVIRPQKWYWHQTPSGKYFIDILQIHGRNTLFCKTYQPCDYYLNNKECLFCKFPKVKELTSENFEDIEYVVRKLCSEIKGNNYNIAISGGSRISKKIEYENLNNIIDSIKNVDHYIPISIEISPPNRIDQLNLLNLKRIDNIIVNIEFIDKEIRKIFCPGKSTIPIDHYLNVLKHCVKILGKYKVSSVLIYGIENSKLTINYAKKLLQIGVIPTILPFRPYDKTKLLNYKPTNSEEYFEIGMLISNYIKEYIKDSSNIFGCTSCGGCSLELDQLLSL